VEVPAVAEGGAVVPRSSVAEVVMAVDVAVAAMAHGRGRGWGGAELCGRCGRSCAQGRSKKKIRRLNKE